MGDTTQPQPINEARIRELEAVRTAAKNAEADRSFRAMGFVSASESNEAGLRAVLAELGVSETTIPVERATLERWYARLAGPSDRLPTLTETVEVADEIGNLLGDPDAEPSYAYPEHVETTRELRDADDLPF